MLRSLKRFLFGRRIVWTLRWPEDSEKTEITLRSRDRQAIDAGARMIEENIAELLAQGWDLISKEER